MARTRIAVIFGGRSSEHAISCVSAGGIMQALDRGAYEVIPVGISPDGRWSRYLGAAADLRIVDGVLPVVDDAGPEVVLTADPSDRGMRIDGRIEPIDVVFPVLHGPWGEDGTIQGLLEMAGLPYVGSGVAASAMAMDKGYMKQAFTQAGLRVGDYVLITDSHWRTDRARVLHRVSQLGPIVFVKPARAGSSVGITRVTRPEELAAAIEQAREHDPRVIVEAAVTDMRELECGVLVDQRTRRPMASVCSEIIVGPGRDFYDFEAKYLDDGARLDVPADIAPDIAAAVQQVAITAFDALACEGLARVDVFLRAGGEVWINEINTMPGFTPISMFPRMWQASGMTYSALVDHLVRDALQRGTGLR